VSLLAVEEEVYTTAEAAKIIGISPGMIRQYLTIPRGDGTLRLDGYQVSGEPDSQWRVYKSSVDALLDRRKRGKTGPLARR
jgi:predicted transcriptional regulator